MSTITFGEYLKNFYDLYSLFTGHVTRSHVVIDGSDMVGVELTDSGSGARIIVKGMLEGAQGKPTSGDVTEIEVTDKRGHSLIDINTADTGDRPYKLSSLIAAANDDAQTLVDTLFAHGDLMFGTSHADFILGGDGHDNIHGGLGADYLDGGAGNDTLWGGKGADRDVFVFNQGKDYVEDFQPGVDAITSDVGGLYHYEYEGKVVLMTVKAEDPKFPLGTICPDYMVIIGADHAVVHYSDLGM